MNTVNQHAIDLEYHAMDLTFSHIRIASALSLKKMMVSLDANGQLMPVIVVPKTASNRYVLIDGYLRVCAMKKLKQDVIKAEIWSCSESDALLFLLTQQGQRTWEVFEEAQVLQVLRTRYQLSQEQISRKIGRTQSWISHRLTLLSVLTEPCVKAVCQGTVSVWAAQRILAPIARAMPSHADSLLAYLSTQTHSTRELSVFLQHYQQSNKTVRENMVIYPELFFKAQKNLQREKEAKQLRSGPEGQWTYRLSMIADQIPFVEALVPSLFYDRQEKETCQALLLPLEKLHDRLHQLLTHARKKPHD